MYSCHGISYITNVFQKEGQEKDTRNSPKCKLKQSSAFKKGITITNAFQKSLVGNQTKYG